MKRILFLSLILVIVQIASIFDAAATEARRAFYDGVRCLGMGGACIAITNDETALAVNPAALGKLRDFYGTIFDPEGEANSQFPGFYNADSFTNPFSLKDIKDSLDEKRGDFYHARGQLFPSFVGRNFGIGILGNYTLDAQMSDDGATIDTFYRNDIAVIIGYNFRFFDGRVKVGFNARLISRIEVDDPVVDATGSLDYSNIATEGVGLGTDVGIILAAPWTFIPTVAAVLRDAGGTKFDKASGVRLTTTERPNMINQDVDVALALFPIHSKFVRSAWTVEYRGLLTSSDEPDKAKLMHGGLELNFGDVFFFRAGYNQRYWTAGFELASERFQWQFATYGEEIGTVTTPQEDRRYTFKFAYRF